MSSRAFIMCREPTIEMKRDFVDMLFKLSPEQLAKVVQILNERCSQLFGQGGCGHGVLGADEPGAGGYHRGRDRQLYLPLCV